MPSAGTLLAAVCCGLVACSLPGAQALALQSQIRGSREGGGSIWQWLFGWGHREQKQQSQKRGRVQKAERAAMGWQAATDKAQRMVMQLSAEEQLELVSGVHNLEPHFYVGNTEAIPRLSIPALKMQDSGNAYRTVELEEFNTTTHWLSPLALGATWDEDMIERVAGAIAEEFKGKGANVLLGPSLNVHRVALNGRNFEYMAGEDPYLGARYAKPYVQAVQRQGVLAVAKHFAFNEQETNRYSESSDVDATTAWELYYPPFEAAVKAGVGAFMCSYNKVNGTQACSNSDLLKRDLKGLMGFKGFVMSDWMATHAGSDMTNGLDQEMNVGPPKHFRLETFTEFGPVSLSQAARDILATVYRLGLDSEPGCSPPCAQKYANVRSAEHATLAREAATASVVLLKNNGTLPLRAGPKKRVAVVGLPAGAKRGEASSACPNPPDHQRDTHWACQPNVKADYYGGGGSGSLVGPDPLKPVEAVRERAARMGIEVVSYTTGDEMNSLNEAEVAPSVDAVLVFAATTAAESMDRASLKLDDGADRLISRFSKLAPTVVCMQTPGAVLTPWRDQASAIVNLFLAGEETANAWAATLFGDHTPEGKMPIALPATKDDQITPSQSQSVPYSERIWTSYRSPRFKWAFPFGHGLSYTEFSYGEPRLLYGGVAAKGRRQASDECEAAACVRLWVTNTGAFAGREVVQAYLRFDRELGQPKLQLRNFQKTALLQPGKREEVTLEFTERELSVWDLYAFGWVRPDTVEVHIGSSSADIRRAVNVTRQMAPAAARM